jgi:hypothetical protein
VLLVERTGSFDDPPLISGEANSAIDEQPSADQAVHRTQVVDLCAQQNQPLQTVEAGEARQVADLRIPEV